MSNPAINWLSTEAHRIVLLDWMDDTTGPALVFSPHGHRLYLAFTGADYAIWILSSTNGGTDGD